MSLIKDCNVLFTNYRIRSRASQSALFGFTSVATRSLWRPSTILSVSSRIIRVTSIKPILLCFVQKDHTSWANHLLKRGKRRTISDIRRSIGDGQTLVYILETLGRWKSYLMMQLIFIVCSTLTHRCWFTLQQNKTKGISVSRYIVSTVYVFVWKSFAIFNIMLAV